MERGYAALQVMENHLKTHQYFAAGQLTVADIALYGYTHVAEEGGFSLDPYPAVRAWLDRVAAEPVQGTDGARGAARRCPAPTSLSLTI